MKSTWLELFSQNGALFNAIMSGTDADKTNALVHINNLAGFVDNFNNLPDDLKQHIQSLIKGGVMPVKKVTSPKQKIQSAITLKDIISFKSNSSVIALDYAYLNKEGWLIRSNLDMEIGIKLGFKPKREALIPIDVLTTIDKNETILDVEFNMATFQGKVITDKKSIDFESTNPEHFPIIKLEKTEYHLFNLKQNIVDWAKENVKFAGKDELRPVMSGICFNANHMAVTDAHKLSWLEMETDFPIEVIIPSYFIKYLFSAGVVLTDKHIIIKNEDSYSACKLTDGKYPNWKAVIPKENPTSVVFNRIDLLNKFNQLIKIANKTTSRVVMDLENNKIHAGDLDFNKHLELEAGIIKSKGELMTIGVNGKFIIEILKTIQTENVLFEMSAPNRPLIINGTILLMLIMLDN